MLNLHNLQIIQGMPFYLNGKQKKWVEETFLSMKEEEKLGQLFCIMGDAYPEKEREELVKKYCIGGVLFRPGPLQKIKKSFSDMEAWSRIPLLKAANLEEGGAGILTDGTYFGNALGVAAADDPECTKHFARACAVEGRMAGVNWTFSPVVDIDWNYLNPITNMRTFGSNPQKVLEHASLFVKELQKAGIAAACKHFPGDGRDYRDQHLHPTYNDLEAEEWHRTYGHIYKTLIKEGLMSIMAGHIVQPGLIKEINPLAEAERELPASLSRELLTGILREKYGFQGVIITDATIMGGYTMAMERKKAIPSSIQAGCDMICFSTDIYEDLEYMREGLKSGLLTQSRLDEAVLRILAMKEALEKRREEIDLQEEKGVREVKLSHEEAQTQEEGLWVKEKSQKEERLHDGEGLPEEEQSQMGQIKNWAAECTGKAVTLVKDTQGLIPVNSWKFSKIRLVVLGKDGMYDGSMKETAAQYLLRQGFQVEVYDPFEDDLHGTACLEKKRLTLILANFPAASNQTVARISWCPKHALEIPRYVWEEKTAMISFANPYHLQDVPRVKTYINAYTATKTGVIAALERLLGRQPFTGKSPVDPFCGLRDTRF